MKQTPTLVALVLAVASALPTVQAQEWPNKPVRVVTAFAAGSASDILARMVAEDFQGHFKQSFVVDNNPVPRASSPLKTWPSRPPMVTPCF